MPTFRTRTALGIGEVNNNILAGSIYEFMARDTQVVVAATASIGDPDINMGVNFGSRTMMAQADGQLSIERGADEGPQIPENVLVDDIADAGERLQISLTGGVAASIVVTQVQFREL